MDDFDLIWLRTISEDARMIAYRPNFRRITGSVTAAILLQQILYRWVNNGFKPFYKYKEPCDATDYREGDSWCEELAFSREEFDSALKRIGSKVTTEKGKDLDSLVWYRVMGDRKTWYEVNYDTLRKSAFPLYAKRESPVIQSGNHPLPILYTKNTSEITTKSERANPVARAEPPTPPPTATGGPGGAASVPATKTPRLPNDSFDMPTSQTPPPTVAPGPPPRRKPATGKVDGRKFKGGRIPAGQGANAVEVFYERHSINEARLSAPKEDDLLAAITDLERWRAVVIAWHQSDYKPTNIKGQLDWYRNGIPERNSENGQSSTGFGLTAYAEKERKQYERDFGPDEELTPEKEQRLREYFERRAQDTGV